jgi:hypothetical protein
MHVITKFKFVAPAAFQNTEFVLSGFETLPVALRGAKCSLSGKYMTLTVRQILSYTRNFVIHAGRLMHWLMEHLYIRGYDVQVMQLGRETRDA